MADLADVETEIVNIIVGAVYPNGTSSPSIVAVETALTAASAAGATNVQCAGVEGLQPGYEIRFYGGTAERALVAKTYTPGATTVPLVAPLGWNPQTSWPGLSYAHSNGSLVTWNDGVTIARGWPVASAIDSQMAAGRAKVSVYSQPNVERNTTRYPRDDQMLTAPVHTLTATVSGKQVSIGGTVATPQNVIVLCGLSLAFPYSVQANDTLASIATALAALIALSFPGTSASGATVTIAGNPGAVRVRVAGAGTIWTEQRRQERGIQVSCWCPTPALRDQLVAAIDLAFAQIDFLTLADQSAARVRYERTIETDAPEKVQLFRRDLFYTVEYPTATTSTAYETGAIAVTETGGVNNAAPAVTNYV